MYRAWGLFGSPLKEKIIQWLYLRHDKSLVSSPNLAREVGVTPKALYRPLQQLVADQLVIRETTPLGTGYRAPFEDSRLKYLFIFLRQDSVIVSTLKRALRPLKAIEYVCIFGRFVDLQSHGTSDIDVLLVSPAALADTEQYQVMTALSKAADKIGREINHHHYTAEKLRTSLRESDGYSTGILAGPRIDLKGTLDKIA